MQGLRRWHLVLFLVLLAGICRASEVETEDAQDENLPRVAYCDGGIGGKLVRLLAGLSSSSFQRHISAPEPLVCTKVVAKRSVSGAPLS